MKLSTLRIDGNERAAVAGPKGLVLVSSINEAAKREWSTELYELIRTGELEELRVWYIGEGASGIGELPAIPYDQADYAPLYRNPRKIWGIGMNYVKDAEELKSLDPNEEPVGFLKPDTSIIGMLEAIQLPPDAGTITAEAELAVIIGRTCKNIAEEEALDAVAGYTASLDMTAADIHARNHRFLTRAKSFDTFFAFGPQFLTKDEVEDVLDLHVETVQGSKVMHRNIVSNMRFRPAYAIAYHSKVMTLLPGDIIMTGTPGSVVIRDGDVVECRIDGFEPLICTVRN